VDWALVNSKRFKAAVMSGCCEDPATVNYSNGLAYLHDARQWGYPPPGPEDEAFWAPYSLVRNAARVDTPILIQTADRQYRMALATVAALKEAGKPIEMYVFPNEYHVKWQPAHRLAVYRRVIDWFDFWLLGREDPSGDRVNQYRRWRAMRASMSAPGAPGL
jgi:dipeptidyl aminopeptidase/acylaminoacyl peptidase